MYGFNFGIAYPAFGENSRFEIKLVILQIIQNTGQFGGHTCEDPHDHIRNFYSIYNFFDMRGTLQDELCFTLFLLTLRDEAKRWPNSLEQGEVSTWDDLIEKVIKKFCPPFVNARRRKNLITF